MSGKNVEYGGMMKTKEFHYNHSYNHAAYVDTKIFSWAKGTAKSAVRPHQKELWTQYGYTPNHNIQTKLLDIETKTCILDSPKKKKLVS